MFLPDYVNMSAERPRFPPKEMTSDPDWSGSLVIVRNCVLWKREGLDRNYGWLSNPTLEGFAIVIGIALCLSKVDLAGIQ